MTKAAEWISSGAVQINDMKNLPPEVRAKLPPRIFCEVGEEDIRMNSGVIAVVTFEDWDGAFMIPCERLTQEFIESTYVNYLCSMMEMNAIYVVDSVLKAYNESFVGRELIVLEDSTTKQP